MFLSLNPYRRNPLAQTSSLLPTLRPRYSTDGRLLTSRLPQGLDLRAVK